MFGALFSFLGGNAFRLIFGEVAAYFSKRQEHQLELERLKLQGQLDASAHERNLESIKLQSDLGIKLIEVKSEAILSETEATAWAQAVTDVGKSTGIRFLDIWNGSVRPLLATISIGVVLFEVMRNGFTLNDWDRELVGAILGIYVADRHLQKLGK